MAAMKIAIMQSITERYREPGHQGDQGCIVFDEIERKLFSINSGFHGKGQRGACMHSSL